MDEFNNDGLLVPARKNRGAKKSAKGKIAFAAVIAICVITVVAAVSRAKSEAVKITGFKAGSNGFRFTFGNTKPKGNKLPSSDYVAMIRIEGVIEKENKYYSQKWLLDTISDLEADSNNKGIILLVNSPGGGVYQADEVYLALMQYKSATERPIFSYFGPIAASGGYYIACASDYIMANRNSLTGSIGVIAGQFVDATGLMKMFGVKSETIHAGRNKVMGSLSEPITDEQREIMQSIADECYEQFVGIVSEARDLPMEVVYELADGRIYTAAQAKKCNLIDGVGSLDDLQSAMNMMEFNFSSPIFVELEYERNRSLYERLTESISGIGGTRAGGAIPRKVEEALESKVPYPAYYYEF